MTTEAERDARWNYATDIGVCVLLTGAVVGVMALLGAPAWACFGIGAVVWFRGVDATAPLTNAMEAIEAAVLFREATSKGSVPHVRIPAIRFTDEPD